MPPDSLARTPYIAGKALGDERGFFGREDIFRLVVDVLSSPDQNALVLFGQRRIGKTSILLQLRRRLPSPPLHPVYFDLMDRAGRPIEKVLYELAATLAMEFGSPQPKEASFTPDGDYFREEFLPSLYRALAADVRPVLMFDEFDVLDVATTEHLPQTAAARLFFPYLRAVMESQPRLGFIFVVGRKTEELSIAVRATFKGARYHRISVLDQASASNLVGWAERSGGLSFSPEATVRLLDLTGCHPFFTQLMCQLAFDRAYALPPETAPTVQVSDVEALVPLALEAGKNQFEWIWDGLRPLVNRHWL